MTTPVKVDYATQPATIQLIAKEMYEAYIANCDGLTWDRKHCPTWEALEGSPVRSHWCAVAVWADSTRRSWP